MCCLSPSASLLLFISGISLLNIERFHKCACHFVSGVLLFSPPGRSVPWDYNRKDAQHPGTGLWCWSRRGDKRPAWLWCSGSVALLQCTKGRRWQQQELQLENFTLELLWVMNPRSWGDSCQPGPRAVGCGESTAMGEAAFQTC